MKKGFTYNHVFRAILLLCMLLNGGITMGFAQNAEKITVTLKVRTGSGSFEDGVIYSNAKVWDATLATTPEEVQFLKDYRTDKNGEVKIKVIPDAILIVGEYLIDGIAIDEIQEDGKNYFQKIEVKGRSVINVLIKETMTEKVMVEGEEKDVVVTGEMKGNTMELSTKMLVKANDILTNNRFIWQPVIINQSSKEIQYGRAFVLDGKEYSTTQLRNYDNRIEGGDPLYEAGLVRISHDSLKLCKVKRFRRPVGKKVEIDYAKAHGYFNVDNADTTYFKIVQGDTIPFANRTDSIENYYFEFTTRDNIFVDHPLTPFAYVIESLSEDYEKIIIKDSVDVHIYGVLHPLRLLDVKYQYVEMDSSLYQKWWPKPIKGPMATEGSVDLKFLVGKSTLDNHDPHNAMELSKVQKTVTGILAGRGTKFTGLRVSGKSSPEGDYQKNLNLAQGRLNTALRLLKGYIPSDRILGRLKEELTPSVATWQEVADSMRVDSLFSEAEEIEKIIAAHSTGRIAVDINNQGRQISRLSFYGLIKEKYLPKFRRVDFVMQTYVNRSANIDEIRDMYANGEDMDEYSFHQLYANEPDTTLRYKYCKEAYERHPHSIIFRTDHAGHLIAQNRPDTTLLSQYTYLKRFKLPEGGAYTVPEETRINQVISLIKKENFDLAGKIAETYLSGTGRSEFAKRLAQAYCGSLYNEDGSINDTIINAVSKSSVMNEIIIRMAIKGKAETEQRQRAMELCDTLLKKNKMDAMANFLKAICLKRQGKKGSKEWNQATIHLYRALEADPQLIELAKTDRDLYERLYDEEMPIPILRPKEDWEYELGLTK